MKKLALKPKASAGLSSNARSTRKSRADDLGYRASNWHAVPRNGQIACKRPNGPQTHVWGGLLAGERAQGCVMQTLRKPCTSVCKRPQKKKAAIYSIAIFRDFMGWLMGNSPAVKKPLSINALKKLDTQLRVANCVVIFSESLFRLALRRCPSHGPAHKSV